MPIPNGTQAAAANQPQFQSKPPQAYQTNFANSQAYDEQTKDYANYQPQAPSQMKTSNSNLSNVNDLNSAVNAAYQKTVDKSQAGGYHTPPPTNFPNSLLNQQAAHPSLNANQAPQPAQFGYISMVHPGMQVRMI